ncbi:MAG: hypothetical protein ACK58T_27070, partial [Phycisphaerae bacterium]
MLPTDIGYSEHFDSGCNFPEREFTVVLHQKFLTVGAECCIVNRATVGIEVRSRIAVVSAAQRHSPVVFQKGD